MIAIDVSSFKFGNISCLRVSVKGCFECIVRSSGAFAQQRSIVRNIIGSDLIDKRGDNRTLPKY